MKYFAVIDTNVLVSSMLKGTSIPGIIVDKAINGPIVPLLNNGILGESVCSWALSKRRSTSLHWASMCLR